MGAYPVLDGATGVGELGSVQVKGPGKLQKLMGEFMTTATNEEDEAATTAAYLTTRAWATTPSSRCPCSNPDSLHLATLSEKSL